MYRERSLKNSVCHFLQNGYQEGLRACEIKFILGIGNSKTEKENSRAFSVVPHVQKCTLLNEQGLQL